MKNYSSNELSTASVVSESMDEQLDEKTQEMKGQIYGQCLPTLYNISLQFWSAVDVHFPLFFAVIRDIIRKIKDPEKPATLGDLKFVYENGVEVPTIEVTVECTTAHTHRCNQIQIEVEWVEYPVENATIFISSTERRTSLISRMYRVQQQIIMADCAESNRTTIADLATITETPELN